MRTGSPLAPHPTPLIDQFYVIVTCRDQKHQVEMLTRFKGEGLTCKAVVG
ncbi:MAG: hypothetical protein L0Y71_08665 [Gemmataceae bacterium]|nr:hypothetical protein [Gemmataceae bacterium]